MLKSERLVAITLLLQARGKMTAEHLADILGVSVRTIYRDMDSLSLAHIPVSMEYGPGGGYFLPEDYRVDSTTLTSEEAVALALGGAVIGDARLFESSDDLRRALFKLEATLPAEYRPDLRAARERILVDTTSWYHRPVGARYLEKVRGAVWAGRQLDILYPRADSDGTEWRQVEPHGLVCKAGIWYLVAYCRLRQDFRIFRVDRIDAIQERDEATTPRPDFDLEAYWEERRQAFEAQTAPFVLTLRVTAKGRRYLESDHTVLNEEPGSAAIVQVNLSSAAGALSYALSLGVEATVVAPSDLREAVRSRAEAIAALYTEPMERDSVPA